MLKGLSRYLITTGFVVVLLFILTPSASGQSVRERLKIRMGLDMEDGTPLDEAEDLALTELNRWRLSKTMMPFLRNETLDRLAEIQAEYIMERGWFHKGMDFHTDAYGGGVISRLQNEGWPAYDYADHTLGGENAAFYLTVDGAINFWKGSKDHRDNVETIGFREIGVAAYAFRDSILIYTVFGGRPNVLPVIVDAKHGWAFMSYDESYYSEGFRPTRVGFYNDQGVRLHDQEWLVWSRRMALPGGITENFVVLFTDGITTIRTDVNIGNSLVYPAEPESLDFSHLLEVKPVPTLIALNPLPTRVFAPTATPNASDFEIKLMYSSDSFFLLNKSGSPINLSELNIHSDGRVVTMNFLNRYSPDPVTAVRSGGCLQAYSYAVEKYWPRAPRECDIVLSVRNGFRAGDRFWLVPSFDVYWQDDVIATCYAGDFECSFDLPPH